MAVQEMQDCGGPLKVNWLCKFLADNETCILLLGDAGLLSSLLTLMHCRYFRLLHNIGLPGTAFK